LGVRQIAPVALVLALTVAGFLGAREMGERDAQRESTHRADIAAAHIHARVNQSADLLESLRRFMVGHVDVTTQQFADLGSSILSAVDLSAAAWVERVPGSGRAAYERRIGHPIVANTPSGSVVPDGKRPSYLPATLVTGYSPATVPGVDLGREPGVSAAVARPAALYRATATAPARVADGTVGIYLVESAQRVTSTGIFPGHCVLFVPHSWLLAAAEQTVGTNGVQLQVGGPKPQQTAANRSTFTAYGQRFEVVVPKVPVRGSTVLLEWIILGSGLVLAAFAAALAVNAARRARAQRELDHIFQVSPDLIAVAGFDGYFKRINPAFESTLGYTVDELLRRPFVDFVHPDDRERTLAETAAIREGQTTISFENRYVCKDGSFRWLQWNATPVLRERLMYSVARDVTERRRVELELRAAEERYRTLAAEQAALRRVATLVANGVPPAELFAAVAEEVGQLLPVEHALMGRYEPDDTVTFVAGWSKAGDPQAVGTRHALEGRNVGTFVFTTGWSGRIDNYAEASGPLGAFARERGFRSSVGTPIIVDGRLWGVMLAVTILDESLPPDMEARLADFTDLVATAIANAETGAQLAASRARIVATADDTRRRIERDLHDGAQQQLVTLALALRGIEAAVPLEPHELREKVSQVVEGLASVLGELREMSHGIHPAVLSEGGLGPALRTLARRSVVPVELDIRGERRLPEQVEVAAYYVVSEALANAAKYAQASGVEVDVATEDTVIRLSIRDDGVGGADPALGSGLIGLHDRVEALGGTITIASPAGGGTSLLVTLPLGDGVTTDARRGRRD
jgi:PAS domain S-box-containing protein